MLAQFSQADRVRLLLVAQRFAFGCAMIPEDLLQEACSRALAGTRKCKNGLELRAFLVGAMRSIAFDERKKAKTHALDMAVAVESIDESEIESASNSIEYAIENEDEAVEKVALLRELVKNNENAALVMEGLLDELEPAQIRSATGLTQTQYDSARTYIHRRLTDHFKKRVQS